MRAIDRALIAQKRKHKTKEEGARFKCIRITREGTGYRVTTAIQADKESFHDVLMEDRPPDVIQHFNNTGDIDAYIDGLEMPHIELPEEGLYKEGHWTE